jgi:hypothetical protein
MRLNNREVKQPLKGMTVEWLAEKCNAPASLLWKLAKNTVLMYKPTRSEKKPSGGHRDIDAPKLEYKKLLKRLTKILSRNIKHHPAAHGGVTGRSSFTSARPHCGAKFIVTRDIKDFYPSVSPKDLFRAFIKLGATYEFAKFLSSIMTVHCRIPQGGPLSSLSVNLYMLRLDDHLYKRVRAKSGRYGRLTDDFVISVNTREKALALSKELDYRIRQKHLQINEKKREKKGLLGGDKLKDIHSLIVNSKRGLRPKKEHIKKGLELAIRYARCCSCATPLDLLFLADLRQRTAGMMYYLRQADFSPARHIRRMLEAGDSRVLLMLLKRGLQPYKNKWWLVHIGRNGPLHIRRNEPLRLLNLWKKREFLPISA